MKRLEFDGWLEVFQTGTDYEADLVRDRLDDSGLEAVIMRKKDQAFSLTHGSMSRIYVLVPPHHQEEALAILSSETVSDEELTAAALAADPENAPGPPDTGEESTSDKDRGHRDGDAS